MYYFFSEILRVLDSLQLTDAAKVATPVDWKVSAINIQEHKYNKNLYNFHLTKPSRTLRLL